MRTRACIGIHRRGVLPETEGGLSQYRCLTQTCGKQTTGGIGKTVLRCWCISPELRGCTRAYRGSCERGEHGVCGQAFAFNEAHAIPAAARAGGSERGDEKFFAALAITRDQCRVFDEVIRLVFAIEDAEHTLVREAGHQTKAAFFSTAKRLHEFQAGRGVGPPAAKRNTLPAPVPVSGSQL